MKTQILESVPDSTLLAEARSGDSFAFARLWERHQGAAQRFATRLVRSSDVEDLVSESFISVFQALRNGAGPDDLFRPYLYVSMRNLAARWSIRESALRYDDTQVEDIVDPASLNALADDGLDRTLVAQAFRSLPKRWQEVLWYTEIEGMKAHEVAPILGLTANGIAALSYRAREGFRRTWIDLHRLDVSLPTECRDAVRKLEHKRTGRPLAAKVSRHVASCPHCSAVAAEADLTPTRVRAVLVPLFLGPVTGGIVIDMMRDHADIAQAAAIAPTTAVAPVATTTTSVAVPVTIAGLAAVTAGVLVASVMLVPADPVPSQPSTVSVIERADGTGVRAIDDSTTSTTTEPVIREPRIPTWFDPEPGDGDGGGSPPPQPPSPPLLPAAAPTLQSPANGASYASPTFVIQGAGIVGNVVTLTIDNLPAGTVTVPASGLWQAVNPLPLVDGAHTLAVRQQSPGALPSIPTSVLFTIDSVAPAQPILTTVIDPHSLGAPALAGTSEPGATIRFAVDGTPAGQVVADASGAWSVAPLSAMEPYSLELSVTQTDAAGNVSPAQLTPLAFTPYIDPATPTTYPHLSIFTLTATGWPDSKYRVFVNGATVWFGSEFVQTTDPQSGDFFLWGGANLSAGVRDIAVGYVDPVTEQAAHLEHVTVTVTP